MTNSDLTPVKPAEAVQMYLTEKQQDSARSTVRSHRSRLGHFIDWCDTNSIDTLDQLSGIDLYEYKQARGEEVNPVTLKTQIDTLRVFLRFCVQIDAVPAGLPDKAVSPNIDAEQNQRSQMLDPERADVVLDYLRTYERGSFGLALFTLMRQTGLRVGACRAIDLGDLDLSEGLLDLVHRPETGSSAIDTPLKKKEASERTVALRQPTVAAIDDFLSMNHHDITDADDRHPLFTTRYGRASVSTLRNRTYAWTRPCEVSGDCPHGRSVVDCDAARDRNEACRCPSSYAPHAIRRLAITQHLRRDVPEYMVSERCDVSQRVLRMHYDQRTEEEKAELRREYLPD